MTALLRAAQPADIEVLLPMVEDCRRGEGLHWDELTVRAALVGLMVRRESGSVWIIEESGGVAGYMIVTLGYTLEYGGRGALIDELYVKPGHRQRGLGQRALEAAEAYCQRHEAHTLHVIVRHDNAPARRAARLFGFAASRRILLSRPVLVNAHPARAVP